MPVAKEAPGWHGWYSAGALNRLLYIACWAGEVLTMMALILALTVPVQDYALREYLEWLQHPTPENYRAFVEKQRQERAVRFVIAAPLGLVAILLSGPLRKYRRAAR